jgi:hypothetical protein
MEEIITESVELINGMIHVKFNVNESVIIITPEDVDFRADRFTNAYSNNPSDRTLDAKTRWTAIKATKDALIAAE